MERERAEQSDEAGRPSSKRTYRAPALRRLGTVRELTLTAGTVNAPEPTFGVVPKRAP